MLRDETIRRVIQFRDDREWRQFHTPKDLAISLSLEAAELLEIFQWSGANLECRDKLGRIPGGAGGCAELRVLMADVCGLDLDEILNAKVDQNAAKYPVKGPGQRRQIHRADLTVLRIPTAPRPAARGGFSASTAFLRNAQISPPNFGRHYGKCNFSSHI